MAYYYRTHIRNLEEQALIERQKIAAELYQKQLLRQSQIDDHSYDRLNPKYSRKIQDQQTAAYLQRSRLSAELSAMRTKAQNTMNRSRIQSAFQLRKENQQAMQELSRMDRRHSLLIQKGVRQESEAKINMLNSQRRAEQALQQEHKLQDLLYATDIEYERQLASGYLLRSMMRERYGYPY